ncbi:MAG: GIY-YIG nuclease family protein [Xanthomonadales bacterium]|nr:GIY-YIG nuclease family protein [Xanthomonadales bacterium]
MTDSNPDLTMPATPRFWGLLIVSAHFHFQHSLPISNCYLFENSLEFLPVSEIGQVPVKVRGIYVLYHARKNSTAMDVVYVGMARGEQSGAKGRLIVHKRNKPNLWTHFPRARSGTTSRSRRSKSLRLFRQIYRHDSNANKLNVQRTYKPLRAIRRKSSADWV